MERKENTEKELSWGWAITIGAVALGGIATGMYYYNKSKEVSSLLKLWDGRASDKGATYDGAYMRKELKKLTLWELLKLSAHQNLDRIKQGSRHTKLSKSEIKSKVEAKKEKRRTWFKESKVAEKIDLSPVEKIGVLSH